MPVLTIRELELCSCVCFSEKSMRKAFTEMNEKTTTVTAIPLACHAYKDKQEVTRMLILDSP